GNTRALQKFHLRTRKLAAPVERGLSRQQALSRVHDDVLEILNGEVQACPVKRLGTEAHRQLRYVVQCITRLRRGVIVSDRVAVVRLPARGRRLRRGQNGRGS